MGYVHDVAMAAFIPPTAFHCVTGTYTWTAGSVSGTISKHKASAADTTVVNIPILIPSNSVALKGGKLASVEVDYEITGATATSVTATMNKITRGLDTAGLAAADVPVTQDLAAAVAAASTAKHKLKVTVTTPIWCLDTQYLLLVLTCVTNSAVFEFEGAVATFTFRA